MFTLKELDAEKELGLKDEDLRIFIGEQQKIEAEKEKQKIEAEKERQKIEVERERDRAEREERAADLRDKEITVRT